MPDPDEPLSSSAVEACDESVEQHEWPPYVRVLAVLHVLSIPIGFVGFIMLSLRAGWIGAHRQFGLEFWTVTLSAFGWMGLCVRYRRWFENWGRKHWPDGKPTPSDR